MLEVEEAIARLTEAATPIEQVEEVALLDLNGRVLAQDIVVPFNVPSFDRAAMDGYAVRSGDTVGAGRENPVRLQVAAEVFAGDAARVTTKPGTAVRIMTGAPIPAGYDGVLRQEDSDEGEDVVAVYQPVTPGQYISMAGEDLREGQLATPQYTRLSSHHIGVLAGMGLARVPVLRPFRVGIVATGDELTLPGAPLAPSHIYNNSSYAIAARLKASGVEVAFLEVCTDDPARFCALVQQRVGEVDAIFTTGGVSVGKKDFIPAAMDSLGATRLFHRVNMKPGTPVMASVYNGTVVLSLSGNPFAALVNFQVFFWPLLAKAMHNDSYTWRRRTAVLCEGTMKKSGLRRFVRAFKNRDGVHLYTKNHRSSVVSNLTESNCIIDQPPNTELHCGDTVEILYWNH